MNLHRILAATLAVAIGVVLAFGASTSSPAQAQEDDPQTIVETFFEELSAGDADAALALIADDFILTDIDGGSFAAVGKPAFTSLIDESVTANFQGEIQSIDAEDGTVTGVVAFSDDTTEELGIERYLQPFVITVEGGLMTRGDFTYDEDDPETAEYLDAIGEDDGGPDGELPPGAVVIELGAQPGGNQPGEAVIFPEDGLAFVAVFVEPGAAGVQQPAHFHTGTCAAPGPIVQPLANVLDGGSFTLLSVPTSELVDQGLIINVHLSAAQPGMYVSCGEVLSAAAQPTPTTAAPAQPTATTAPAATPTRATGITAPSTGTGGTGGGVNDGLFALVALGAIAAGAGALRLVAARSR